jgi:hypothetical protein
LYVITAPRLFVIEMTAHSGSMAYAQYPLPVLPAHPPVHSPASDRSRLPRAVAPLPPRRSRAQVLCGPPPPMLLRSPHRQAGLPWHFLSPGGFSRPRNRRRRSDLRRGRERGSLER